MTKRRCVGSAEQGMDRDQAQTIWSFIMNDTFTEKGFPACRLFNVLGLLDLLAAEHHEPRGGLVVIESRIVSLPTKSHTLAE